MEESRSEFEEQMKNEVEKRVEEGVKKWIQILIQIAISFAISIVVFKYVWAWVVPDLFPGAVSQGLISANLSWLAALKLGALVGVFSGFYDSLIDTVKQKQ